MRQRLTSTDLSIEELLSGKFVFTIPAYQRDYTWTREEAVQLVDDLAAVIEDVERDGASTPYFLGTMLFVETPAPDDRPPVEQMVEVVDGQQRLITLAILLSVIRDLMSSEAEAAMIDTLVSRAGGMADAGRHHLRLRIADEEYFSTAIQTYGATRRGQTVDLVGDSIARRNIEDVRRALRSKLQREFSVAARRELTAFLRANARVLVVSSNDFDYAYQIFLTINDRGKRLSVEDIFRGEILGPLDRDQRRRYEAIIDEMEKYRQEAELTRTKGKTFFSHLAAIDGWPRRGIIEGLKKAVEKRGGPRRFVTDVFAPMAESYLQIRGGEGAVAPAPSTQRWLMGLRWLELHGDDDWVPVAMVGLTRFSGDVAKLDEFLRHLDRFAHALMMLGCGRKARSDHYASILKQVINSAELPPPETLFAMTASNQKTVLRNLATRLHLIDAPTAKLVLIRADQVLSGRPLESYRSLVERDRRDVERFTVEHVCPKGGEVVEEYWLKLFPRKPARQRVAQCIGNLVLITEMQNRRGSQKSFPEKKKLIFADDTPSPFVLTEMLRAEEDWDGIAITRRYNLIMGAVKAMWILQGAVPACPAMGNVPPPPKQPEAPDA
jgi:hypothetical protein